MIELDPIKLNDCLMKRQAAGDRIVFTNGVFDLLHVGHLRYLREARELGDALLVAVNSDASVRRIKGSKRPIVPESDRAEIIDGLRCVDYVTIFGNNTPVSLVELLKPDIYAKGGDYLVNDLPEAPVVHSYGGEVRVLSLIQGRSSTDIVAVIRERYDSADATDGAQASR